MALDDRPAARGWRALAAWPTALGDLVWPSTCVGCAAAGPPLCRRCRGRDVVAVVDDLTAPPDLPVAAAAAYADGLRRALIAYKERRRLELARPLGELLRAAVDFLLAASGRGRRDPMRPPPWDSIGLVAVPSMAGVARARGGQHVVRLARSARRGRGGLLVDALRPVGAHADSSQLGVQARVGGPTRFRARAAEHDARPLVVVDDIVTSGATARDAVAVLQRAGWPVIGVAVVAATPRASASVRLSPVARSGRERPG